MAIFTTRSTRLMAAGCFMGRATAVDKRKIARDDGCWVRGVEEIATSTCTRFRKKKSENWLVVIRVERPTTEFEGFRCVKKFDINSKQISRFNYDCQCALIRAN